MNKINIDKDLFENILVALVVIISLSQIGGCIMDMQKTSVLGNCYSTSTEKMCNTLSKELSN